MWNIQAVCDQACFVSVGLFENPGENKQLNSILTPKYQVSKWYCILCPQFFFQNTWFNPLQIIKHFLGKD